MNAKQKVYALLVGIDKYEGEIVLNDAVVFPKLSGCVPDTKKMKTYLENDGALDVDIKMILNNEATKSEVVRLFKQHLGQAKKDDVAFFFFSGHGTQEWADTETWINETDNKLECLVCYYANDADEFLMADKELRFLIHELSVQKPHIVCAFDCCHSADNTRSGTPVDRAFEGIVEKRLPYVFPRRKWEHFVFSSSIKNEALKNKGEKEMLPEGDHIQLSACESDESALEVSGAGVFTKALFKVLKASGGEVSYQSLNGRVRQYLKNIFDQKPRLYKGGNDPELLDAIFLQRSPGSKKSAMGELVYNEEKGWKFTLGAIHGINEEGGKIVITDPEKPGVEFGGRIDKIEIDSCIVETDAQLSKNKSYNGSVEGLLSHSLKLHVENNDEDLKQVEELMDVLFENDSKSVSLEDDEFAANYVLRIVDGRYFLTRPGEKFKPLTRPVKIKKAGASNTIAKQLKHISNWEFLKNLRNQSMADKLQADAVKIEMIAEDGKTSLLDQDDIALVTYNKQNGLWERSIRVKLTNTSSVNVYVSSLYLASDFSSDIGFLNPAVLLLEPGNSVELKHDGDPQLRLEFNPVSRYYNWIEEVEYLKFIISTDVFDVQALQLEALPAPGLPNETEDGNKKGLEVTRGMKKRRPKGWTTKTLTLRLQNPEPGRISKAEISAMKDDEELAYFANGIYKTANGRPDVLNKKYGAPRVPKMTEPMPEMHKTRSMPPEHTNGAGEMIETSGSASPFPEEKMMEELPVDGLKPVTAPTSAVPRSREGQLEYDIPSQMQTGKMYNCKVNIAGNEVASTSMKIGESSVHAAIRVTDEMSVRMIDPSGGEFFNIGATNTERQGIFPGEMTSWNFSVEPLKGGNHPIVLKITIHIDSRNKDLDILEKEIVVTATDTGSRDAPLAKPDITRILFISANPLDTAPLRIGAETRQIREEIGLSAARDKFAFTINLAVTTRTLSRAILQEDPSIVHFSGHGEEEGLCLETDSGVTRLVDDKALGFLFSNFATSVKCVILNACYSKKQADAIVQHIPYVIGMHEAVKDTASLAFSVGFYQALADGSDIEQAFNMGKASIAMAVPGEENIAVLVKKSCV